MKAKITVFGVVVSNQQKALDFYTKKVGFEKKTDYTAPGGYRYVTVHPEGQDIELSLLTGGGNDPGGWSANWHPGGNPPIVMNVDDCRKAFDELKASGVEFKSEPVENPWGISATFSDPDGNLFSINQFRNPSWQK